MGFFTAIKSVLNRGKSNQIESTPIQSSPEAPKKLEIEKESLQLGMAAGYTGRSLRDIESSLIRIESQMATKEWMAAEVMPILYHLKEKYAKVDAIEQKLNNLSMDLAKLGQIASTLPEPAKTNVQKELDSMEILSWRMREILSIVKQRGEISYEELAAHLNYKDKSALRSILSAMVKRTSDIERFERENKGWIKYTGKAEPTPHINMSQPPVQQPAVPQNDALTRIDSVENGASPQNQG